MPSFAADKVKAGVVRSMGGSPNFVAKEKGFFAEQGIDVDIVFFDSAQPIAIAVASGDCDVGTTGVTAAFFNLAAQGTLRIVGSGTWEHPGFQSIGYLVSNQAYEAGLHSLKDIGGKKGAITQSGTPLQYAIALAAEKYNIDYNKIQILLLQSNPNVGTALTGGQTDFAVQTVVPAYSVINKGGAKLLGWEGDEVPNEQNEAFFTSTKMINERGDVLKRYLVGLSQGNDLSPRRFRRRQRQAARRPDRERGRADRREISRISRSSRSSSACPSSIRKAASSRRISSSSPPGTNRKA